ncbi:MAG: DUF2207 domain-containing protein [Candidatus Nanosyncoccaceae bacterium]|jgi:uncharacterized membrane protein YgcG
MRKTLKYYRQVITRSFLVLVLSIILGVGLSTSVWAGVDDFYFDSLDVEYHLSVDEENRSVLKVKETFVAVFPDFDQNRGMVRAIPLSYQGHSLNLKLGEVYRNGGVAPIAKDSIENGFRRLEIRDDSYIHGKNTFEINYTMHDTTLSPQDNLSIQELYWDVNGTGWGQPFESVRATVFLEDGLINRLTGESACYTGYEGSNAKDCLIERTPEGGFIIETLEPLSPRQNLTFAIGFQAETFEPYQMTNVQKILVVVAKIMPIVLLAALIALTIKRVKLGGGAKKDAAIATQYIPPKGIDVLQSATLLNATTKAATATLIDLAVRHKINIKEVEKPGLFGLKSKNYKIEVIDTKDLTPNEILILHSYLQKEVEVGSSRELKKDESDTRIATGVQAAQTTAFNELKELKYYQEAPEKKKLIMASIIIMLLSITLTIFGGWLSSNYLIDKEGLWLPFVAMALVVASVVILISFATMRLRTNKGADVVHYLKGLEQYIKLAETERLAFNQSVDTAQTVSGKTDTERRVVLYERILPYAMLFNLEKTWNKVLEAVYQEAGVTPDWYIGTGSFSASDFSKSMSDFSSSSSSSSSSGSSGGGSSGGGGGGGGGGGC